MSISIPKTVRLEDLKDLLYRPLSKGVIAVDIETEGTNAALDTTRIVGIGLSNIQYTVYFDRASCTEDAWGAILDYLATPGLELIGHNIFFDGAFLLRDSKVKYNWVACTYGLYRQLATEGFNGQSWSLKTAQVELLGWTETNEAELDQWLVDNDLFTTLSVEPKAGHYPKVYNNEQRYARPNKSQMFRAPREILGYYCGLDAFSTYALYVEVLLPCLRRFPSVFSANFAEYNRAWLKNVELAIEQQIRGIRVDQERLLRYRTELEGRITEARESFLGYTDVAPLVKEFNQIKLRAVKDTEPEKYKKLKLPKQPAVKYKKDGSISKAWTSWQHKTAEILEAGPEVSKNWENWKVRYDAAALEQKFNLNSGLHRQWLFYDKLKYPVLLRTDKGGPAVDKRALLGFGPSGKLLKGYNDLEKELGYVEGCLANINNGLIHPQFRIPGTLTGRLAGSGGINLQQLPKSAGYLSCYHARPDYVWVDFDFTALEQVVMAELTKDKTLYKLYGPGMPKQDVYLFNGAFLPIIGKAIRDAGYDPDNPTIERINQAKKLAKKERSISKVITLGSSYGMGPKKLKMTLNLEGVNISEDEAFAMYRSYWQLYKGVKDYQAYLESQYRLRGGWVYNGIGRPISVAPDYTKDLVNRVVQSTGHDILILFNAILFRLFKEKELEVYPIIHDFHDQVIVETRENRAEEVRLTFIEALAILNLELNPVIPLTGEPNIVRDLAEAKIG